MKAKVTIKIILVGLFIISFNSLEAQHRKHYKGKHYRPHHRYVKHYHWGHGYRAVPKGAFIYPHKGTRYHYHKGIYFKPYGSKYVVVRPPLGIRVKTIPANHIRFLLRGQTYYYYYGTYYKKSNNSKEYVSVSPPIGAKIDALPDGYKKVRINDEIYYELEGNYYKAIIDEKGEVWYELVEK